MLTIAYFDQVHPQFPFLHKPTYLQWEEEVMVARENGYAPNPAHMFFVYAVSLVMTKWNIDFLTLQPGFRWQQ